MRFHLKEKGGKMEIAAASASLSALMKGLTVLDVALEAKQRFPNNL